MDKDGNTGEALPLDLDNMRRIIENVVDMGAYEFKATPFQSILLSDRNSR